MKNYEKAQKLFEKYTEKTVIRHANGNSELIKMIQKKFARANNQPTKSVKQFCDQLITNRLEDIAKNLPDEGFSMGSEVVVKCNKLTGRHDRTQEYANFCKYRAVHGRVFLKLTAFELRFTKIVGGIVTVIYPNQKSKVKKCFWYEGKGSKSIFELIKIEGFIYEGFHAKTKAKAKVGGEKNIELRKKYEQRKRDKKQAEKAFLKAARLQYSYNDSVLAGNCEPGTRYFAIRLGLDTEKKYRGTFLLKIAKEKSTSSVSYVEKMIKSKIK